VQIFRYAPVRSSTARVGILDGGTITELTGTDSLAALLRLPTSDLRQRLTDADGVRHAVNDVAVLRPIDGRTEVWACGVSYTVSQTARMEESERSATVYEQVYDAVRPELFFKSVAWWVVVDGELIAVRADSDVDVPEHEVAVVVNAFGEIVGYIAGVTPMRHLGSAWRWADRRPRPNCHLAG
jgi:2-dehydro-3-deoxy-D-arabinonate dehydratase